MNQAKEPRKELLSVRIPQALARQIESLAALTARDKTSVAVELLERGLESAGQVPVKSANFVPVEDFQTLAGEVRAEIAELKKSLAAVA